MVFLVPVLCWGSLWSTTEVPYDLLGSLYARLVYMINAITTRPSSYFMCVLFTVLCPGGGHSASSSTANNLVVADTSSFFKFWQLQYTVPFFLIVILFPLCSVKSPTFFTKFNALGELSITLINLLQSKLP